MSRDMEVFRVPVVVFTETPAADWRDAVNRAERLVFGNLQLSGSQVPRGLLLRDARRTSDLVVVGIEELNVALRNHNFEVAVRGAGPMHRERR